MKKDWQPCYYHCVLKTSAESLSTSIALPTFIVINDSTLGLCVIYLLLQFDLNRLISKYTG